MPKVSMWIKKKKMLNQVKTNLEQLSKYLPLFSHVSTLRRPDAKFVYFEIIVGETTGISLRNKD